VGSSALCRLLSLRASGCSWSIGSRARLVSRRNRACRARRRSCHMLLANLRPPGQTAYVIPRGYAFDYVTCANYMFEIWGWLAFAFATRTLTAFMFIAAGAFQMAVWARAKHARLRRVRYPTTPHPAHVPLGRSPVLEASARPRCPAEAARQSLRSSESTCSASTMHGRARGSFQLVCTCSACLAHCTPRATCPISRDQASAWLEPLKLRAGRADVRRQGRAREVPEAVDHAAALLLGRANLRRFCSASCVCLKGCGLGSLFNALLPGHLCGPFIVSAQKAWQVAPVQRVDAL